MYWVAPARKKPRDAIASKISPAQLQLVTYFLVADDETTTYLGLFRILVDSFSIIVHRLARAITKYGKQGGNILKRMKNRLQFPQSREQPVPAWKETTNASHHPHCRLHESKSTFLWTYEEQGRAKQHIHISTQQQLHRTHRDTRHHRLDSGMAPRATRRIHSTHMQLTSRSMNTQAPLWPRWRCLAASQLCCVNQQALGAHLHFFTARDSVPFTCSFRPYRRGLQ